MAKKLYAVLGVEEKAGPEELRRAWLRLAVKYHPDRNPGDAQAEERFKEISQAYALLSDPAARTRYERTRPKPSASKRPEPRPEPREAPPKPEPRPGSKPQDPQAGAKTEDPRAQAGPEESSDWIDILNRFFQTPKGRDTLKELEEELRRAGLKLSSGGLVRWLRARREDVLKAPSWLGRLAAGLPGGLDWTRRRAARYDIGYDLSISPQAAASGATVEIACPLDGQPRAFQINLPAGIKNGARLRLPAQGRLRPGGDRGDLVLTVLVGTRTTVEDLWSN